MRISEWSSDVCSSDLILLFAVVGLAIGGIDDFIIDMVFLCRRLWRKLIIYSRHRRMTTATLPASPRPGRIAIFIPAWQEADVIGPMLDNALGQRSEEHTSELQSLMRISYDVFCLKKKKNKQT